VGKSALLEHFAADLTDASWCWGHATGCSRRGRWERSSLSSACSADQYGVRSPFTSRGECCLPARWRLTAQVYQLLTLVAQA